MSQHARKEIRRTLEMLAKLPDRRLSPLVYLQSGDVRGLVVHRLTDSTAQVAVHDSERASDQPLCTITLSPDERRHLAALLLEGVQS